MRKLRLAVPVLVVTALASAVGIPSAQASIGTSCGTVTNDCTVYEDMGGGYCSAQIAETNADTSWYFYGNFAQSFYINSNTGYTCDFWFERNVNNTGWYRVGSVIAIPSSGSGASSANNWNGSGYEARTCFQFNWGSSLGAVHCSSYITDNN